MTKFTNPITFITGNQAKAEQLAFHLKTPLIHQKLDLVEIQSLDLEEIVRDKAKRAYDIVKSTVLVEDVSLVFPTFGKLPGPLIKWFLTEIGNKGLTQLLNGKDRTAIAQVMFGLDDGISCHIFTGSKNGSIAEAPQGELGFGWDPIFIPEGHSKTWGEMDLEEQKDTSMRRIALIKLQAFLDET